MDCYEICPKPHVIKPALQGQTRGHGPVIDSIDCTKCGRCIDVCPKDCIHFGTEIDPATGLTPVVLDLDLCNSCGLCTVACPEPYGLMPTPDVEEYELEDPEVLFGPRESKTPVAEHIPDQKVPLPSLEPMVLKGNHAAAVGFCGRPAAA